jgi:large subunit ribosomal protein L33
MAKKESRVVFHLVCTECNSQNYISEKSKRNTPDKLEFKKYCPKDKKVTIHKESQKMK